MSVLEAATIVLELPVEEQKQLLEMLKEALEPKVDKTYEIYTPLNSEDAAASLLEFKKRNLNG